MKISKIIVNGLAVLCAPLAVSAYIAGSYTMRDSFVSGAKYEAGILEIPAEDKPKDTPSDHKSAIIDLIIYCESMKEATGKYPTGCVKLPYRVEL